MIKQTNLLNHKPRDITYRKVEGDAAVTPIVVNLNNTYENENAPKKISFSVNSETAEKMLVKSELKNHFGEITFLQEDIISNGDTVSAKLPDLSDIYGIFYIIATVYDENGNELVSQHIPFSHIRTGDGYLKRSGIGTHLVVTGDLKRCEENYTIIKRCGLREVRDDLLWRACEPVKGKPVTPEGYKTCIKYLYDNDIKFNCLFVYGNDFYDNGKAPKSEEGINAYANYVKTVVRDLGETVDRCEIWNEYNDGPVAYFNMLKVAYTAIKEVNPNMQVTAGVTIHAHTDWIRRLMECGGYDYCDALSLHPYCCWTDIAYPDEFQGAMEANAQSYIDIMSKYGEPKPVWISEIGWTSCAATPSLPDRHVQAAAIARAFVISESSQILDRVVLYDYHGGGDEFDKESHWGIVDNGIVPNSAVEAYVSTSTLNWLIGNAEYASKSVTNDVKHTVFNENGKDINIFWSLDGEKQVTLEINGTPTAYDVYGNVTEIAVQNGIANIIIDEAPLYIVGATVKVLSGNNTKKVDYDYTYSLSAVPVLKEDGWYVKALVKCHQPVLNGRLRIELPELDLSGNFANFKIKDGESFETEIKVGFDVNPKHLYRAFIDLSLRDGTYVPYHEMVSFLGIPYGKPENTVVSFNSKDNYSKLVESETPELSTDVAISYDEENFYFKAVVEDKIHIQHGTTDDPWTDIWDGDGFELILQPLNDGNKDLTRYNHIGLALTSNTNESIAWRWRTVTNRGITLIRNCDFKAERKGNFTEYNFTMKWRDLLPSNVSYNDCDSFGFSLRLNNSDIAPCQLDGYSQLYGGIGSWRRPFSFIPAEFGRFVLLPKKD